MITAKDIRKELNDVTIQHKKAFDDLVGGVLMYEFKRSCGAPVRICSRRMICTLAELGIPFDKTLVVGQLGLRGFHVEYECEDRPAGSCFFLISLPPEDE